MKNNLSFRRPGSKLSAVLCALLLANLLFFSVCAEEPDFTGYTAINSAQDLSALFDKSSSGKFYLTDDITLGSEASPISQSIGKSGATFSGVFDGNGHTITIYAAYTDAARGLFGVVTGGTIRNLTVAGSITSSAIQVGGLVGKCTSATIENCVNTASVTCTAPADDSFAGGIVGYAQLGAPETLTITNCSNAGDISGVQSIGGIVGATATTGMVEITECYNSGGIEGTRNVAGIVGRLSSGAPDCRIISVCQNVGDITATREKDAYAYAGGIVGEYTYGTISDCLNTGNIINANGAVAVGGALGGNSKNGGAVAYCLDRGTVTGTLSDTNRDYIHQFGGFLVSKPTGPCYYTEITGIASPTKTWTNVSKYSDSDFDTLNANGNWIETVNGPELAVFHIHTPKADDGDCMTPVLCSACGGVVTPANASHAYPDASVAGAYITSDTQHWQKCIRCAVTTTPEAHTYTPGSNVCSVCGFVDASVERVVYVTNGGTGDGSAPDKAVGTLTAAYTALGDAGGRIVVVEKLTLTGNFTEPAHTGTVTLTQEYAGVSYRSTEGHGIVSNNHRFFLNGPTVFENLTFRGNGSATGMNYLMFVAQFNPIEMGEGVRCEDFGDMSGIPKGTAIIGGVQKGAGIAGTVAADLNPKITVKSGEFMIAAFSRATNVKYTGTADIGIYGGTIHNVYMGMVNPEKDAGGSLGAGGNVDLTIHGGSFVGKLIGVLGTDCNVAGNIKVTVKGGDFSGLVGADGTTAEDSLIDISALADKTQIEGKLTNFTTVNTESNVSSVEIKMTIGDMNGYVNGVAKVLDAAPIIRQNRTMLPVRFVAENLGAAVAWDGATGTATLTCGDIEVKITIGAKTATVNGEEKPLDAPAFIENSRTYLPVRFVAEALGGEVAWDGATGTATITK